MRKRKTDAEYFTEAAIVAINYCERINNSYNYWLWYTDYFESCHRASKRESWIPFIVEINAMKSRIAQTHFCPVC